MSLLAYVAEQERNKIIHSQGPSYLYFLNYFHNLGGIRGKMWKV